MGLPSLEAEECLCRLDRIYPRTQEKRAESGEDVVHEPAGRREAQREKHLPTVLRDPSTHLVHDGIGDRHREIDT